MHVWSNNILVYYVIIFECVYLTSLDGEKETFVMYNPDTEELEWLPAADNLWAANGKCSQQILFIYSFAYNLIYLIHSNFLSEILRCTFIY